MSTIVSLHGCRWPRRKTLGVVRQIPGILSPPYSALSDGDGEYNIWLVQDGTPAKITPFDENTIVESKEMYFPVLSPDKRRIVFRGLRLADSAEQLLGVNWTGGVPNALVVTTVSGSRMMHPMWHPDSDQIVYVRGVDFAFGGQIELTDFAGASPTVLYTPSPLGSSGYVALRPQFNRDGTKIAFWLDKSSGVDATEGLYVMDADGANVTQIKALTAPYRFDGAQLAWANTQDKLVYEYGDDVFVINADGTGETTISVGETATQQCRVSKHAWAADDGLVYISSFWFDGSTTVWRPYSCDPAGGGVIRLNDLHGPFNQANATNLYRWFVDNRLYFIETYASGGDGKLASMAIDGTDYRIEHLLSAEPELSQFYAGTGIEFV